MEGPQDVVVAGKTVYLDQRAANAVGEVIERVARISLEVVSDVRGGVEPSGGEADPVEECRCDPVLPATTRVGRLEVAVLFSFLEDNCPATLNFCSLALMVLQASSTAIPLRSDPALAAVGGVLGTVSVEVSWMWTLLWSIPRVWAATWTRHSALGATRHLDHFGVEALPHLGPPVGQQHRAVSVDIQQRSVLVK
jgi:hypothetical protein